jgi:predicted flap endonuclease-1-like 5' DNA nuclease
VYEVQVYRGIPAVAGLSGDNLKEIVGIGHAVESRLHTLGIISFRQLAVMGDADVDRLARQLEGFGDRIVSDDWVGQARDLQARYYGGLA